jgi:hypothetical protein
MALYKEDKRAAFVGLVVTTLALVAVAWGIVLATNAKFAGHEKAAPGAPAAAQHG